MIKSNKAITLIALIITIIVLLILAGVTINMVLGENGIVNKSKSSVAKYENAQEKENIILTQYINTITSIESDRDLITIDRQELNRIINEQMENKTSELDYANMANISDSLNAVNESYTFLKNGQLVFQMGINNGGYYYATIKNSNNVDVNWIRFHNATSGGQQHTDHTIVNKGDTITVTHINNLQTDYNIIFIPFK